MSFNGDVSSAVEKNICLLRMMLQSAVEKDICLLSVMLQSAVSHICICRTRILITILFCLTP